MPFCFLKSFGNSDVLFYRTFSPELEKLGGSPEILGALIVKTVNVFPSILREFVLFFYLLLLPFYLGLPVRILPLHSALSKASCSVSFATFMPSLTQSAHRLFGPTLSLAPATLRLSSTQRSRLFSPFCVRYFARVNVVKFSNRPTQVFSYLWLLIYFLVQEKRWNAYVEYCSEKPKSRVLFNDQLESHLKVSGIVYTLVSFQI